MTRLTLIFAATLLLAAPATALAQEDGGAGMPLPTCQSDADCDLYFGDGSQCFDGICQWAPPPTCSSDAECSGDDICRYGYCEDRAGYCQTDDECGQYQRCHKSNVATPIPMPTEPALPPEEGGSSDGSSGSSEPSSDPAAPAPMPEPEEEQWGRCRLDFAAVPEVPSCRSLCEQAAACAPTSSATATSSSTEPMPGTDSGEGEADAPPQAGGSGASWDPDAEPMPMDDEPDTTMPSEFEVAECVGLCSYTVAVEAGTTELVALVECVDGSTCEAIESTCEAQAEAWIEAIEDDDEVIAALGIMSSSDSFGGSAGATAPIEAATGANVQGSGPSEDIAMGCDGSGAGSTPSALVLALLALGLLARRRTA